MKKYWLIFIHTMSNISWLFYSSHFFLPLFIVKCCVFCVYSQIRYFFCDIHLSKFEAEIKWKKERISVSSVKVYSLIENISISENSDFHINQKTWSLETIEKNVFLIFLCTRAQNSFSLCTIFSKVSTEPVSSSQKIIK